MKTRMEKYYTEDKTQDTMLRQHKNESLYENIGNYEVDYKLENNVTVLDSDAKNIDVEQIKKILDTKYNKEPKRRSIVVDEKEDDINIDLDETREYDINAILEKARSEKELDYEKERVKKIRDTQYDILNSLDLEEKEEEQTKEENSELMELINTITARELDSKEEKENLDPLDILTDLKGNEDTVIVGAVKEEESINETSPIMSLEEAKKAKEEKEKEDFTSTLQFTQSDFDDFNDLKKEVKSNRVLIYLIIIVVTLVLAAGLLIFLNKFLNLSLF